MQRTKARMPRPPTAGRVSAVRCTLDATSEARIRVGSRARSRRARWLKPAGAGVAAALAAGALISCGPLDALPGTKVDTVGQVPFENRLATPPLADSELDSEGRRVFTLTAQPGESELLPAGSTETWGFNGSNPRTDAAGQAR